MFCKKESLDWQTPTPGGPLTDHCCDRAEHDKWRVGNLEPLQPQEESPFIGQLDPGKHQLAIETNMFRAPGFAYTTPPTDFLLIRSAIGAISLRELTGCIAVGQEVPAMRAPVPHSREVRQAHMQHEVSCMHAC